MARRTETAPAVEEADASTAAPAAETTDATVAPAADSTTAAPEEVVDLTAFEAALAEAIAAKDVSTGDVPEANIDAVNVAYSAVVKAGKPKARAVVQAGVRAGMDARDINTARAYMQVLDKLSAEKAKTAKEPKAPADPTEAFVQRVGSLQAAYQLVTTLIPEGVAADWLDKVNAAAADEFTAAQTLNTWLNADEDTRGDEPEVSEVAKAAVRLANGKSGKIKSVKGSASTFDGPRRDIAKHITEWAESVPSGTFAKIAEIRAFKSTEYGDDHPSPGAISIRLFPAGGGACTIAGITPTQNAEGVKGATKN